VQAKGTALVTGGAKRIGRTIVEDLAANGYAVAIHANSSFAEAEALANSLRAAGADAYAVQADLCKAEGMTALIAQATDLAGPIDLLVNNASVFEHDALGELSEDVWDRHFDIHVKAPAFLAQAFAAALPSGTNGLIVNMIDQRVWRLTPNFFSYTLSKSALWTATRTMAQALAPQIRVNGIGLGPTLKSARQSEEDFARQQEAVPLQHGAALTEIGATIRYLAENGSITGQMIALDGGQHLAWETPDVAGIAE